MTGLASTRIHRKSGLSDEGFKESGRIREIKHALAYFEHEGIKLPPGWDSVDIIREIRNQIVHDAGIRHGLDDVKDPVELTRHKRSVKIDKFVEEREAQGKKGIRYHHDCILAVSADFCREILEFLRDYVKSTRRLAAVKLTEPSIVRPTSRWDNDAAARVRFLPWMPVQNGGGRNRFSSFSQLENSL